MFGFGFQEIITACMFGFSFKAIDFEDVLLLFNSNYWTSYDKNLHLLFMQWSPLVLFPTS